MDGPLHYLTLVKSALQRFNAQFPSQAWSKIENRKSKMAAIPRMFGSLRNSMGLITWGPLVRFSRSTVLAVLSRIEVGQIIVVDSDGTTTHCGGPSESSEGPKAELRVVKDYFWVRALLFADMVRSICMHRKKGLLITGIRTLRSECPGLC